MGLQPIKLLANSTFRSSIINLNQKRTSFYNKYRHGPTKLTEPVYDHVQIVRDFFSPKIIEFIKTSLLTRLRRKHFPPYPQPMKMDKTVKFEKFDNDESIKKWKAVADSDSLNGYSVATIKRSTGGHAMFTGFLDCRLPEDGLTIDSGFVAMAGPRRPWEESEDDNSFWDWSKYNCLELRFRGDGRKYGISISTSSADCDLTWFDTHFYPLYTTGGPYWQTIVVPFSKFVFCNKGFVQDEQEGLPCSMVNFIAFTLQDNVTGPFSLEIDYVGLVSASIPFYEDSAYEGYMVQHDPLRRLQVDCAPPDRFA